jgi:glutamate synthase (ferredoxin)
MTGGRVVVLGQTGRNFAAGMSGGIAYVLDVTGDFPIRCNQAMVTLSALSDATETAEVHAMIERHAALTGSERAQQILKLWKEMSPKFVKVIPKDYERVLESLARVKAQGLSDDDAVMAAFEENARNVARVGGN